MKSHDSLIRLRKFEVDERRQKVADLESMIDDFQRMARDLDRQVEVEQQRAGTSDMNDCRYPLWAKDAITRRERIVDSVAELEGKLDGARDDLASSFEELKKVEKVGERETARVVEAREAEERDELDEIASSRHHRQA
ncbi:MAG: flagellar export protein FliJ [bacterium]|nr:flagellar export protein FliJ [bacterium]